MSDFNSQMTPEEFGRGVLRGMQQELAAQDAERWARIAEYRAEKKRDRRYKNLIGLAYLVYVILFVIYKFRPDASPVFVYAAMIISLVSSVASQFFRKPKFDLVQLILFLIVFLPTVFALILMVVALFSQNK